MFSRIDSVHLAFPPPDLWYASMRRRYAVTGLEQYAEEASRTRDSLPATIWVNRIGRRAADRAME